MNKIQQYFSRKYWVDEDVIDLAYRQLKLIFPLVDKQQEIKTSAGSNVLVDIAAYSSSGQLIIFDVKNVPPNTTLGYYAYPGVAGLRDEVSDLSPEKPPIVVLLAVGRLNEEIRNLFAQEKIPLVSLGPDVSETRLRLRDVFQKHDVHLPEFTSLDEQDVPEIYDADFGREVMTFLKKLGERESTPLFGLLTVALLVILGILLAFHERIWLAEFVSAATAIFAVMVFSFISYREGKKSKTLNPYLIIERDERKLVIKRDKWIYDRRILLKARRQGVDRYLFRLDWTGSLENIKVTCEDFGGKTTKKTLVDSNGLHKQLWELKFDEPMRKGEIRSIALEYILPDPKHQALPYHRIAYTNVWECKEFESRLVFADNLQPKAVYFVQGSQLNLPLTKTEIMPDPDSKEYVVHEKPDSQFRYSIEWEWKNGALE